ILETLWPKTFVNPEVVKKYILEIRKALGERRDQPAFIKTFFRRGYQFVAPIRLSSSDATNHSTRVMAPIVVGRGNTQERLDRCLEKALQGHRQVVFVTGEAGIGKTTVVDAFSRRASGLANWRIARGQCVEGFGSKEPYYPILEAFAQLIGHREADPLFEALLARAPTWFVQYPALIDSQ